MAIIAACNCGKSFKAKPELAGKRVKCPSCGESIQIPVASGVAPMENAAATSPIAVTCQCGKSFKAPPKLAGKQVVCPACKSAVSIPHPQPVVEDLLAGGDLDDPLGATGDDPLGNLGDLASDPLMGAMPMQTPGAALPNYAAGGPPATKTKQSSGFDPKIILYIGGGIFGVIFLACAGLFVMGFVRGFRQGYNEVVQEQEAARERLSSSTAAAKASSSSGTAHATNNSIPVGDYADARSTFKTKLTRRDGAPQNGRPITTSPGAKIVTYRSGDLELKAVVSDAPDNAPKKPGLLFLHGGFAYGAGDWEMVQPFVEAGYYVMIPSLRGENGQPGHFSLYYDEVDDVLAAAEVFASLPYVDEDAMFIAGHSAGGTLTALACLASDRFRAGASFSGLMEVDGLLQEEAFQVFDAHDRQELQMRSALAYATSFKCPMRLIYGSQERLFIQQTNETAKRAKSKGMDVVAMEVQGDHFSSVDPAIELALTFFGTMGTAASTSANAESAPSPIEDPPSSSRTESLTSFTRRPDLKF